MDAVEETRTLQDILIEAVRESGLSKPAYALEWGIPRSTFCEWMKGTRPAAKHFAKINERFPGIILESSGSPAQLPRIREQKPTPVVTENPVSLRIRVATGLVIQLMLVFEWLIFKCTDKERNAFRDALGAEWEWFMNLSRSMVSESSLQVMKTEGRLNTNRRHGL